MIRSLLFVRHGRTDWNDAGRLQGRRDIALNAQGLAELSARRLPGDWCRASWYCSPLQRAVRSAQILGAGDLRRDALLTEMDWGRWEGRTLPSLRAELGRRMDDNEAQGLDFRPEGGESPREVRDRLQRWLCTLPLCAQRHVVVSHKGVMRAALSLASGWPMTTAFAPRVDWSCAQEFSLTEDAVLKVSRINVSLPARSR